MLRLPIKKKKILDVTRDEHFLVKLALKGICDSRIALLGQFCAEVVTVLMPLPKTQNAPVELRRMNL